MYRIGIDLGGTKTAAGLVDETGGLLYTLHQPTGLPRPADILAGDIAKLTERLLKETKVCEEEIAGGGIGIPGTVNPDRGVVEYANNFDFVQVPFVAMLQEKLPFGLKAENDAKAAAWGEFLFGAGKGADSMLMVTLGTGVGGAFVEKGRILRGYHSGAGEIGHMVVERGGRQCTCGRRGCLEAYASAGALVGEARKMAESRKDSYLYQVCEGKTEKIDGKLLMEAVRRKDTAAMEVYGEFLEYLGEGLASLINILDPQLVCIGGGLSGAGDGILIPLRERVLPLLYAKSDRPVRLEAAGLGNEAGIIGAAFL